MHLQDDIHVQMNAQQHNILNPFDCLHRKLCVYLQNSHWTVLHYGTISCHSYLIWKPLQSVTFAQFFTLNCYLCTHTMRKASI